MRILLVIGIICLYGCTQSTQSATDLANSILEKGKSDPSLLEMSPDTGEPNNIPAFAEDTAAFIFIQASETCNVVESIDPELLKECSELGVNFQEVISKIRRSPENELQNVMSIYSKEQEELAINVLEKGWGKL